MGKINVAIIGVGNCASSFVQGVHYYREAAVDDFVPGLMHVQLGDYHISDINFVAAFDIDKRKAHLSTQICSSTLSSIICWITCSWLLR